MRRTKNSTIRSSGTVTRHAAYSLAAGAAAAATCGDTQAAIRYSGLQNLTLDFGFTRSIYIDDQDDYLDIQFKNFSQNSVSYQGLFMLQTATGVGGFQGTVVGFEATNGTQTLSYASSLGLGVLIDQSTAGPKAASLAKGPTNPNAQFNDAPNAYLGLSFPISGDGSLLNHFGWVRIAVNNAAMTLTIKDWAYETVPGASILVGQGGLGDFDSNVRVDGNDFLAWQRGLGPDEDDLDAADLADWKSSYGVGSALTTSVATPVPEPTTLGFLAAGVGGVALLRRLRRRAS